MLYEYDIPQWGFSTQEKFLQGKTDSLCLNCLRGIDFSLKSRLLIRGGGISHLWLQTCFKAPVVEQIFIATIKYRRYSG